MSKKIDSFDIILIQILFTSGCNEDENTISTSVQAGNHTLKITSLADLRASAINVG